MLNNYVGVGRLVSDPQINETKNGRKESLITIAIPRSWKNGEGIYETDFVPVRIFDSIATNTSEYCHKGDVIGVKGRIQTYNIENEDGTKETKMEIIAEKITFLSSKSKDEED